MICCQLADVPFCLENRFAYTERLFAPYRSAAAPVRTFRLTDGEIECEINESLATLPVGDAQSAYAESLAFYRKIAHALPAFGGFLLHAAVFSLRGHGIAYAAPSGTGKSTQAEYMRSLFSGSNDFAYINGDKPLIREKGDRFFAYGTPFCGKENRGTPANVPLCALCFLARSDDDRVEKLSPEEAFPLLLPAVLQSESEEELSLLFPLLQHFLRVVPLFRFYCTNEPSAAETLINTLTGEQIL